MFMAENKEGLLAYNAGTEKFEFYSDRYKHTGGSFCCGSVMEIYLNLEWKRTRLEHNGAEWYLVGTGLMGKKLENQKIRIKTFNGSLLPF